nr:hypothetical protein [Tanacetum cinerariifolium]
MRGLQEIFKINLLGLQGHSIHVQSPFFFFTSNDTSGKRGHFSILGFGSADVAVVALSSVVDSVVVFRAGTVDATVSAIFSMTSCGGVPAQSVTPSILLNGKPCLSFTVAGPLVKTKGWFVPENMAKFMKESQDKDTRNLMKLQILGREFELRVGEKNIFIEKLKGTIDY